MSALGIDDGLRRRLRDAGEQLRWSPARPKGRGRLSAESRRARFRDEEARVDTQERAGAVTVEATAGPLGALLVLLEADRRGPPSALGSRSARAGPFPEGSIVAVWGDARLEADARPTLRDLVDLARYALP